MADRSAIEWTDATWNPVTGCSKVSPGCAHCYAEAISLRFGRSVGPWTPSNAAQNVVLHPERLDQPLKWKRPRMIFVNSMSDLFHEQIPDEYIARVFAVMANADQHVFQVLTKRPERMREMICDAAWWADVRHLAVNAAVEQQFPDTPYLSEARLDAITEAWVLSNVWLGVSIENRRFVHRADTLREVPAAVRVVSAEPLLGPLIPELDLTAIDWLIAGGESGPGYRPVKAEWMRDLRDECEAQGVAFFLKQMGGSRPGTQLEDLPEDLRIREMPASGSADRLLDEFRQREQRER